jgi:hypothetical protein
MQLTGHKTRNPFERYNIVSDGDLRAAARKIGARLRVKRHTLGTGADSNQPEDQLNH